MGGAKSRRKGAGYEREVCAEIFETLGMRLARKLGQARDSGNDIDLPLDSGGRVRIECKRRARIGAVREWMDQVVASCHDGDLPVVVMRADGWPSSLVVLDLAHFLLLVREELKYAKSPVVPVEEDVLGSSEDEDLTVKT